MPHSYDSASYRAALSSSETISLIWISESTDPGRRWMSRMAVSDGRTEYGPGNRSSHE